MKLRVLDFLAGVEHSCLCAPDDTACNDQCIAHGAIPPVVCETMTPRTHHVFDARVPCEKTQDPVAVAAQSREVVERCLRRLIVHYAKYEGDLWLGG